MTTGVPTVAQQKQIQLVPVRTRYLASLSGLRMRHCMSCGVGRKHGSDPALLWLWCRLAAAAPILPLAWQLPYATGAALKKGRGEKKDFMFAQ